MNYQELNDFELISYVNENNEEAKNIMFDKYKPLIISIAKRMAKYSYNSGLDMNDLIQEGMIGFSHALASFNESRGVIFYTYAKTCIERNLINTLITANRKKHKILNDSISLDVFMSEQDIKDNYNNPEEMVINDANINELKEKIKIMLTPFELQVFDLKVNGFEYREIADILDRKPKDIDNALQRIKNKLKEQLNSK